MRILICTDTFKNGGLETNIITFAKYLSSNGEDVFLCTDKGSSQYLIEYTKLFRRIFYLNDTLSNNWDSLCSNSESVKIFIKRNKIDFLVIHPFNCFLYSVHASVLSGRPYVLFFHGPTSVNQELVGYQKDFLDFWMKNVALRNASYNFCVSEEVLSSLQLKYKDFKNKSLILNNPVPDLIGIRSLKKINRYILLASRIDKSKYDSIIFAIEFFQSWILPRNQDIQMYVAGNGDNLCDLNEYVKQHELQESVKILGFKNYSELLSLVKGSEIVMGMGRVCLEGISLYKNVILTGYDGLKGFIKYSNVKEFSKSNFSGRTFKNVENKALAKEFFKIEKKGDLNENSLLYKYVMENYSISSIGEKFCNLLLESFDNKSYLNYDDLVLSMISLDEKRTSLFGDLKNSKKIISKQIEKLSKLEEELIGKDSELTEIKRSRAWKIICSYRNIINKFRVRN